MLKMKCTQVTDINYVTLYYNNRLTDFATNKVIKHLENMLQIHALLKTIKVQQKCLDHWWIPKISELHKI